MRNRAEVDTCTEPSYEAGLHIIKSKKIPEEGNTKRVYTRTVRFDSELNYSVGLGMAVRFDLRRSN